MNNWQRACLLALATVTAVPACRPRSEDLSASTAPIPDAAIPKTPAEWIGAAKKFRDAPNDSVAFRALLASHAFDALDQRAIGDPSTLEFFPVFKELIVASLQRPDDMISLVIFSFAFYRSFALAGETFIAGFPPDDPTLPARRDGLLKLRDGSATSVAGALMVARSASTKKRDELVAALMSPGFLSWQTRESMTSLIEKTSQSQYPTLHAAFVEHLAKLP